MKSNRSADNQINRLKKREKLTIFETQIDIQITYRYTVHSYSELLSFATTLLPAPLRLKSSFLHRTFSRVSARPCRLEPQSTRRHPPPPAPRGGLKSRRAHPRVCYCSGEVSKQEDGQTDRRTCRQTDTQHKTGLWLRGPQDKDLSIIPLNML